MTIEIRITLMGAFSGQQLPEGDQILIRQAAVTAVTLPTRLGRYKTELGTVAIDEVNIDAHADQILNVPKLRQHIKVSGSLIGQEVIVPIEHETGAGMVNLNPEKTLNVYVSEGRSRLRDTI